MSIFHRSLSIRKPPPQPAVSRPKLCPSTILSIPEPLTISRCRSAICCGIASSSQAKEGRSLEILCLRTPAMALRFEKFSSVGKQKKRQRRQLKRISLCRLVFHQVGFRPASSLPAKQRLSVTRAKRWMAGKRQQSHSVQSNPTLPRPIGT